MTHEALLPEGPENRELAAAVRPAGWRNPTPEGRYNLVVVGAGTAGLVAAAGAAGLGAKVALVERHLMGGDCLMTGCVPSKALIRAARALHDARSGGAFGLAGTDGATLDFASAMQRMRAVRSGLSRHDSARRFQDELGVDVFFGEARFVASDRLEVEGATLLFKRCAVCTGTRAKVPPVPGLAEAGYLTNETVFSLTDLPRRLAVVGAGPVGCELAQVFARFGSRVTLVASGDQILPREDRDAAQLVHSALSRDGVEVLLQAKLLRVEGAAGEKVLQLEAAGKARQLPSDDILVAVGRAPNVEGLQLEKAGVAYDASGVTVSDALRTSNPKIYASGDICSAYKFTHTADAQSRILIANALFGGRRKVSRQTVPWCTYTDPEVAHVGLYEKDAAGAVRTFTVPLAEVDRAVLDGDDVGFARLHLEKNSDRILGATIVARHAGDLLSEITLAMQNHLGLAAIGNTIHPYPTQGEVVRKVADAYQRTRLTPLVRRLFLKWFSWQRR